MEAWSEHPYRDIVDNRVDFEHKVSSILCTWVYTFCVL
jgi:type 1 glutamine amidotransferase